MAILQDLESRLRLDLLLDEDTTSSSDGNAAGGNRETPKAAGEKRALEKPEGDRTSKKRKFGNKEHESTNPIPDFEVMQKPIFISFTSRLIQHIHSQPRLRLK